MTESRRLHQLKEHILLVQSQFRVSLASLVRAQTKPPISARAKLSFRPQESPGRPNLTGVKLQATVSSVKIRNFVHKGLKRLYAEDSAKGVAPDTVDKLRKMLAFLDDKQDPEELRSLPAWKVRTLTGDRKGTWSLTVTRNRRLTFRIDIAERELCDLNLEDYH